MAHRGGVQRLEPIGFWTAVGLSVMLLALLVAMTTGYLVEEPAPQGAAASGPAPAPEAPPPAGPAAEPAPGAPRSSSAPPVVLIRAVRGDCWIEARAGSADGEVLFAGVLPRGTARRLRGNRVWLRLGAGENVDVTVGGRRASVPGGTGEVLLGTTARRASASAG